MLAAKEGRSAGFIGLRVAILWGVISLGLVAALSYYKQAKLQSFADEQVRSIRLHHLSIVNLFQANYFFFYEDQFLPRVREELGQIPGLESLRIISKHGNYLYDSKRPEQLKEVKQTPVPTTYLADWDSSATRTFLKNFSVEVLVPSGDHAVIYRFSAKRVRNQLIIYFVAGLALILSLAMALSWLRSNSTLIRFNRFGLRFKFLATIVLINLLSGAVIFVTLSALQTREETNRIRRQSLLFSQFSTSKIISDFSNLFYFYYNDRFIPSVNSIIASNENLLSIKIVSSRSGNIVFNSDQPLERPVPLSGDTRRKKAVYSTEINRSLKARGIYSESLERNGEQLLYVVNAHRNEQGEPVYSVEYLFRFETLKKSVNAIRRQILLDLLPAILLGLVIAILFSQFLISPIRRLSSALRRVTAGNYNVTVDIDRSDEIGDLIKSFNAMTNELRKKKELQKYLSESTYRRVMEAEDSQSGFQLKGQRVLGTVLMSDIRNFVEHCEALQPEEVTEMLNEYFSEMVDVVYRHGGEVDKFIGDALLAVFYAREPSKSIEAEGIASAPTPAYTALQALYCGLEMRDKLEEINARRREKGAKEIEIGVGITFGELISGPIGSRDRRDFTIIGDVVNLASRIEKLSKKGKHTRIVFSNHIEDKIKGLIRYERIHSEKIRGKEEEVTVYELVGILELEHLTEKLMSDDIETRIHAVEILGYSRNYDAVPNLIQALSDSDADVRIAATQSLANVADIDDDEVLDAFFRCLSKEKDEKVISGLISGAGKLCRTDRILEIRNFLDYPNERIVANAIEAVGQARLPQGADLILPKLASLNNRVKANAALALFAAGHPEVIDTLKPMLMHSDPRMRSSAAFALGELTGLAQNRALQSWGRDGIKRVLGEIQECVPMLVSRLKDSDLNVKRQTIIALGRIRDKSAVLPLINCINLQSDPRELIEDAVVALRDIGSHRLVREVFEKLPQS